MGTGVLRPGLLPGTVRVGEPQGGPGRSCHTHRAPPGLGAGAHVPAAGALPGQEVPVGRVGLLGKACPCSPSLELASLVTRARDKLPKPQQVAVTLSAHCTEWETEAQSGAGEFVGPTEGEDRSRCRPASLPRRVRLAVDASAPGLRAGGGSESCPQSPQLVPPRLGLGEP